MKKNKENEKNKKNKKKRRISRIHWLIYLALFALSLVAISFFGGTVSYSFFFAVLLIPPVCLIYLIIVLLRFRIYQEIGSRTIVSGDPVSYFFTLQNEDRLAFSSVHVRFYSDFSEIEKLPENPEYELLPNDRYTYETRLICRYRGEYEVGVRDVVLTDFMKLFRLRYRFPGTIRASVLPKIVEIHEISALKNLQAPILTERYDQVTEPDSVLRDYVAGDPVKLIGWKKSARAGKLKVRNLIREERNGAALLFSTRREDKEAPESYIPAENKILEIVIAIMLYAAGESIPLSLIRTGKKDAEKIGSISDFEHYYARTPEISFGRTETLSDLFRVPAVRSSISELPILFIVEREISEELYSEALAYAESGHTVILYTVTKEQLPDFADGISERLAIVSVGPDQDLKEVL